MQCTVQPGQKIQCTVLTGQRKILFTICNSNSQTSPARFWLLKYITLSTHTFKHFVYRVGCTWCWNIAALRGSQKACVPRLEVCPSYLKFAVFREELQGDFLDIFNLLSLQFVVNLPDKFWPDFWSDFLARFRPGCRGGEKNINAVNTTTRPKGKNMKNHTKL